MEQGAQFARQLPKLLENVKAGVGWVIDWGVRWEIPIPALPAADGQGLEGIGQVLIANTLRATAGVIGAVLGLLIVLILAAFLITGRGRCCARSTSSPWMTARPARAEGLVASGAPEPDSGYSPGDTSALRSEKRKSGWNA